MKNIISALPERFRDDLVMVDALYQWASTPTGYSAIARGLIPDHTLIKSNLRIRYTLSDAEAEHYYSRLIDDVSRAGYRFETAYLDAGADIRTWEEGRSLLAAHTTQRLDSADPEEQQVLWLFCQVKDSFRLWPHSRDHAAFHTRMNRFRALLSATFGFDLDDDEILRILIRIGFINELEWISPDRTTGGTGRETELVLPSYLDALLRGIEDHIPLPPLPRYQRYADTLLEERRFGALIALDGLARQGYRESWSPQNSLVPYPFITGNAAGIHAINIRILEDLQDYLAVIKRQATEKIVKEVRKRVLRITEHSFPDIACMEEHPSPGIDRWRITVSGSLAAGRDLDVVLAAWLTDEDLVDLRDTSHTTDIVIVSPLMDAETFTQLYRKVLFRDPGHDPGFNGVVLDGAGTPLFSGDEKNLQPITRWMIDACSDLAPDSSTGGREAPAGLMEEDALRVFLGYTPLGEGVWWSPGSLQNGHLIIIGGAGAGKTETIRCITSELHASGYPVLMIDFHGDMECEHCEISTYRIRENSDFYFNPLELDPLFEDITPLRATSEFVDAMFINFRTLGIQQRNHLKALLRELYHDAGITADPSTWNREVGFADLRQHLQFSDVRSIQSLQAYLNDIFDYGLFNGANKISVSGILSGGITSLNLRALPESLRFLYADLFLREVYHSMQAMGEIPRGDTPDHTKFRLFVIVDEAKLLVSEKQGIKAVLNKYAGELRKFGVGIILASQVADHFPSEVLANIESKLCMRAQNEEQARKNARYFGVNEEELLSLAQGEGIFISGNDKVNVQVMPTWERPEPSGTKRAPGGAEEI